MTEESPDHVEGVDFTDINPLLDRIEYPIRKDDLVAEYGDETIERTNANPITIRELLDEMGDDSYDSPESVRQSMLNVMPSESVGRQRYSDRGGATPDTAEQSQDESL